MQLRESIESINEKLKSEFGTFTDGRPNFRVIFSEDQYEKRYTNFTDEGFELIYPEIRLLPKYKQYIKQKYILERLVPVVGETDLTEKTSYEPAWVFQDKSGNYLPPWFDGCRFVIDSIHATIDKAGTHAIYRDPLDDKDERDKRLELMQIELFGNETEVGDALAYGSGVGFTKTVSNETNGKVN